ncbi:hypothetical protein A2Y85_05110 [candidate division WOR-3 bacterium RBG_13_43_14]|uniref:Type II secretion system protein GspG C-terminal domain-containing protein n=1 Tax=candidate division WOR-3 bacterium RBG_13_43_14 TaxID=1802590 RepID=A0A1F4U8A4_UNCW3|nr:MAG: hypothetical protein A2Y85_05110 [candidate division WOR-3 bacterium RBG_13_43_14]
MTVVVIIGIIIAMTIPNLIDIRARALEASLKANMHAVHLAVEEFCTIADGVYPGDLDTRISQVCSNPSDQSLADGRRIPPFSDRALLRPHTGLKNPFNAAEFVVDNLLIYPPVPVPPRGCTYYSSYLQDGCTPSAPGQIAYSFRLTAYGHSGPLQLTYP